MTPTPFSGHRTLRTLSGLNERLNIMASELAGVLLPSIAYIGNNTSRARELQSFVPSVEVIWPLPKRTTLVPDTYDLLIIDRDDCKLSYDDIVDLDARSADIPTIICTHQVTDPIESVRDTPLLLQPQSTVESLRDNVENMISLSVATLSLEGWVPLISSDNPYLEVLEQVFESVVNGDSVVIAADDMNELDSIKRWLCNRIDFPGLLTIGDTFDETPRSTLKAIDAAGDGDTAFVYQASDDDSPVERSVTNEALQTIVLRARHQFSDDDDRLRKGNTSRKTPLSTMPYYHVPEFPKRKMDAHVLMYFAATLRTWSGTPRFLPTDTITDIADNAITLTQCYRTLCHELAGPAATLWQPALPPTLLWKDLSLSTLVTQFESLLVDAMLTNSNVEVVSRYLNSKPNTLYARRRRNYPRSTEFFEQKAG